MEQDLAGSYHSGYKYPFSAIVGQNPMKLALTLNAIDPGVGGLLIRGEKGTAKSTAVRALANILPEIEVTADCPYSCDPDDITTLCDSCRNNGIPSRKRSVRVVDLPLNATEEMVVGGLDFSATISDGARVFQPGLMARANRGILYIDEVNLLSDHLVDAILDVTASGENVVQRESISHRHPARFILVGTMNPEEGELRPQLLDRFGLFVNVQGEQTVSSRIEVLQRRDAFDRFPHAFCEQFEDEDKVLAERIRRAREILPTVEFPKDLDTLITEICLDHKVAGHRADIVIAHTARALAAFEARLEATIVDVRQAASFAIPHRSRKLSTTGDASAEPGPSITVPKRTRQSGMEEYPEQAPVHVQLNDSSTEKMHFGPVEKPLQRSDSPEAIFEIGETFKVREFGHRPDKRFRQTAGKRTRTGRGTRKVDTSRAPLTG